MAALKSCCLFWSLLWCSFYMYSSPFNQAVTPKILRVRIFTNLLLQRFERQILVSIQVMWWIAIRKKVHLSCNRRPLPETCKTTLGWFKFIKWHQSVIFSPFKHTSDKIHISTPRFLMALEISPNFASMERNNLIEKVISYRKW